MFELYDWVPEYNTPIKSYVVNDIENDNTPEIIGNVPNTNLPIKFNFTEGIKHHLAILGVTGSGKSVLSRKIVRDILNKGTNVIAVDFTNEYIDKFGDLEPYVFFSGSDSESEENRRQLEQEMNNYRDEMDKFPNQRNKTTLENTELLIAGLIESEVKTFLKDEEKRLAILEYPDMTNSVASSTYLKWFFEKAFRFIRTMEDRKDICIVLEEAHTIVPEWNNIGGEDVKTTQSMIHTISQIALQGRKYNVGFIVIAQRTANVSKTVLTQCNSIIAFQQFDNTSREFLSNHLSEEMVKALSRLKKRYAIVSGKAFESTTPVIIQVPEINEQEEDMDWDSILD